VTGEALRPLPRFGRLQGLEINGTALRPLKQAALRTVAKMTSLRRLTLANVLVTDASMTLLAEALVKLESLTLCNTFGPFTTCAVGVNNNNINNNNNNFISSTHQQLQPCGHSSLAKLAGLPALHSLRFEHVGPLRREEAAGIAIINSAASAESGVDDETLLALRAAPKLEHLSLESCSLVTNVGLAALQGFSALTSISLSHMNQRSIDRPGLAAALGGIASLTKVALDNLGGQCLTDDSLVELAQQLPRLEELSVTECAAVSGASLRRLSAALGDSNQGCALRVLSLAGLRTGLMPLAGKDLGNGGQGSNSLDEAQLARCLTSLEELSLTECPGLSDKGLAMLGSWGEEDGPSSSSSSSPSSSSSSATTNAGAVVDTDVCADEGTKAGKQARERNTSRSNTSRSRLTGVTLRDCLGLTDTGVIALATLMADRLETLVVQDMSEPLRRIAEAQA
jgi:hypothetical protein